MDVIRWPYRANMLMRKPDGSMITVRVQWQYAASAAKPLKFPHGYGSSAYYDPQGFDLDGPGEIVETGRERNRRAMQSNNYLPTPCPDDPEQWNPQ